MRIFRQYGPGRTLRRALLLVWLAAGWAGAHPMLQNPLWIEITPRRLAVKLQVSVRELCVVQGLPITVEGTVDEGQAEDTAPRHSGYVLDHLEFRADGGLLTGRVLGIDPPERIKQGGEGTDNSHFTYRLEYPLSKPLATGLTLTQTMVKEFPSAPGVPWDLSYAFRCGTAANPMKSIGVLPRDTRISFRADGSMAAEERTAGSGKPDVLPPAQAGLMALWAALGLNAASRRDALRVAVSGGVAFAGGGAAAVFGGFQAPGFVLAALAGVGVLLTAVDNIHRPGAPPDRRRFLLAVLFSLAAGLASGHLAKAAQSASAAVPAATAFSFALPAAVTFLLTAVVMLRLEKTLPPGGVRVTRQLLSLACAAVGLLVLFHGLGIRPWDYWVSGISGRSA
ncbi:MAG: hypothetical protein V4726_21540 [Verrucomicrobiota bacterium]